MQHSGGSDVTQSVSLRLSPSQSIVHDQQRVPGFQRQMYRLALAVSKARRKRLSRGYRHYVQPSLVGSLLDSRAVFACFPQALKPDRLWNAEPREQVSGDEQRVDFGEGDQRSGIAYDVSHGETSSVSVFVVSSCRTISMPKVPRCWMNSLKERPLIFAAFPSETLPSL